MAELTKVLSDIAKQYPKQVFSGCKKTGFIIERQAKLMEINRLPGTGNLRSSISTHINEREQEVTVTAGGSAGTGKGQTADVSYAVYNEFGTRYMEPKLFMTYGAEIGFQQMAGLVIDEIEKIR